VLFVAACGDRAPKSPATPTPPPVVTGLTCGVERWAVKTLSDAGVSTVVMSPAQSVTIKDLNLLVAHCSGHPELRSYPEEFSTYSVVGRITLVRLEDDRDYHIALADPDDPAFTIVTEIPDSVCEGVVSSPFFATLFQTRASFQAILAGRQLSALVGTLVRVRGVGFYDFNHNQTGRSQSCIELHPLIGVELVQ
jgi:hypothetical protein